MKVSLLYIAVALYNVIHRKKRENKMATGKSTHNS